MIITNITETGSNNILLWAIKNNANIKTDRPLQSIINDQLAYLITCDDIGFFELFRLCQIYRKKVRIIDEYKAEVPSDEVLSEFFPGECKLNDNDDENYPLAEIAKTSINQCINLVLQMSQDSDIISPTIVRLIIPMISRRFKVQIPISFMDFLYYITDDEAAKVFTVEYPNTLPIVIDDTFGLFHNKFRMEYVRATSVIAYDKRYDQLVNILKYNPLKSCKNHKLYKFALISFFKYDNINRGETRFTMFNTDQSIAPNILKHLNKLKTPLYIDIAIELPIQQMQLLCNTTDNEMLTIFYESSMANIINHGFQIDDVITNEPTETEGEDNPVVNQLNAYRIRLSEANHTAMNALTVLLKENELIDTTSAFSILPSIYTTRAVITFDISDIDKLTSINDPVISDMFNDIKDLITNVSSDIASSDKK